MLTALLVGVALSWLALLLAPPWGRGWELHPAPSEAAVQVVIPARNEVGNIGLAVRSVLASTHRALTLTVVDDQSEDATAAEAIAAAQGDPRFHLLPAPPRPEGWAGKSWAVQNGAVAGESPYLLLIDADVRLHPEAIGAALARAEADAADLLSLFGSWELVGFWERVAIPAVGWLIRGAVPLAAVNANLGDSPAFANGQFILLRRAVWASWGGHEAVRGAVLDDVGLAEVARGRGGRLRLLWAPWAFRVRLYRSLGEIVAGYQKNFYEGMKRRFWLALVGAGAVAATSLLPLLLLPALWASGRALDAGLAALSAALMSLFRLVTERRDGRSGWNATFHFLGAAVLVWILLRSATAREVRWKGRRFVRGRSA